MTIINKVRATVITETYTIDLGEGRGRVIYIDYLDKEGQPHDAILRSEDGHDMSAAGLFDEIQEFLDKNEPVTKV
jgi:hypothetical protein